eukprot:2548717-Rhodomonas_salina.1
MPVPHTAWDDSSTSYASTAHHRDQRKEHAFLVQIALELCFVVFDFGGCLPPPPRAPPTAPSAPPPSMPYLNTAHRTAHRHRHRHRHTGTHITRPLAPHQASHT